MILQEFSESYLSFAQQMIIIIIIIISIIIIIIIIIIITVGVIQNVYILTEGHSKRKHCVQISLRHFKIS